MATYKGAASEAGRAINLMKKRQKEQEEIEAKKKKIEEELKIGAINNKFAAHYDAIEQTLKSNTIDYRSLLKDFQIVPFAILKDRKASAQCGGSLDRSLLVDPLSCFSFQPVFYNWCNKGHGLVTLTEMRAKQESVVKEREKQLAKKNAEARLMEQQKEDKKRKEQRKITMLSFDPEDDVEDNEDENEDEDADKMVQEEKEEVKELETTERDNPPEDTEEKPSSDEELDWRVQPVNSQQRKKKRFGMNPEVDTSFLPDRDRDEEENRLREQIQMEWESRQASIKNEEIEITYSYWDGSGHRRQARMKKGNSIQQFLQKCLETLRREFNDLKSVTVDQLMYVKEDLIIPHHYLFYDFIVTKARGKSGPLFNFDAHEDIRVISDARIEKDESHAGKVCLRSWYERNKHIFPASRWEPYDPEKKWDNYSISDKNAAKITVK